MNVLALIQTLRQQGVKFAIVDDRLRVIQPRNRPLSDVEKAEVRRHTGEILRRLKAGGITPEDVTAVFPGAEDVTEAIAWLRVKLSTPQHIALVVAEWVATFDRPSGRNLDTLMQVRWVLDVHAYVGKDNRLWWRLPQETAH